MVPFLRVAGATDALSAVSPNVRINRLACACRLFFPCGVDGDEGDDADDDWDDDDWLACLLPSGGRIFGGAVARTAATEGPPEDAERAYRAHDDLRQPMGSKNL